MSSNNNSLASNNAVRLGAAALAGTLIAYLIWTSTSSSSPSPPSTPATKKTKSTRKKSQGADIKDTKITSTVTADKDRLPPDTTEVKGEAAEQKGHRREGPTPTAPALASEDAQGKQTASTHATHMDTVNGPPAAATSVTASEQSSSKSVISPVAAAPSPSPLLPAPTKPESSKDNVGSGRIPKSRDSSQHEPNDSSRLQPELSVQDQPGHKEAVARIEKALNLAETMHKGNGKAAGSRLCSQEEKGVLSQEPIVKEQIVKEHAVKEPIAKEHTVNEPIVNKPIVKEPAVKEPAVKEPAVKEPAVKEPAVKESMLHSAPHSDLNVKAPVFTPSWGPKFTPTATAVSSPPSGPRDNGLIGEGKMKPRCKFWPHCTNKSCKFTHPSLPCRDPLSCAFGNRCNFIHPNDLVNRSRGDSGRRDDRRAGRKNRPQSSDSATTMVSATPEEVWVGKE